MASTSMLSHSPLRKITVSYLKNIVCLMSFVLIIIAQQKLIDHNLRMRGEEEDQGRCKERSAKTDRITLGFQRWQDVEILIRDLKQLGRERQRKRLLNI